MRATAALCLVAAVLAGCGAASQDSAKEFEGEERVVAVTVEDLEDAARRDQPARICERLLARTLVQRLRRAGTNCRTAVNEALDDADAFDLTVEDITIRGTTATVKVTSGTGSDEKTDTLLLEREGRAWKIASLGEAER